MDNPSKSKHRMAATLLSLNLCKYIFGGCFSNE
nr:MAG TPA: hypothetical protein [Caudoviricetes sp.]